MGDTNKRIFRVGSRKSELALIQTNIVIKQLQEINDGSYEFSLVTMDTIGDKILDKPLPKIGEKSLFTQELEKALEDGEVDFVVHSLKDLPTALPQGKVVGAVLQRLNPSDCVVMHEKHRNLTLRTLPKGSVIGTSSLRRTAQISHKYPHLKIESIRGNMNTRLKKLNAGLFDAIVVAVAGLERLNWKDKINEVLDCENIMYAVGQGALAVECMANNREVLSLLVPLMDRDTALNVIAERSFLRKLEGGCSAPVAVNCALRGKMIQLKGLVSSLDGRETICESVSVMVSGDKPSGTEHDGCSIESGEGDRASISYCGLVVDPKLINTADLAAAEKLGEDLADQMIAKGALIIMEKARKQVTSQSSS